VSFAQRRGIDVQHFKPHGIEIEDVKTILKEQGTEPRVGDVLFLRTGYVGAYKLLDESQRKEVASVREWCGLAQGEGTTEWLWDRQFAAVVSDSPGFEVRRKYTIPANPYTLRHVVALVRKTDTSNSTEGPQMASAPYFAGWVGNADWRVV
jgi:hypothetical protein